MHNQDSANCEGGVSAEPPTTTNEGYNSNDVGVTSGRESTVPVEPSAADVSSAKCGTSCTALGLNSPDHSPPPPSSAAKPPLTGIEEEAWQLKRLDIAAVRRMYGEVLSGEEPLVVAALKRGGEHLLDTLGV